jgi:hypothetical protein
MLKIIKVVEKYECDFPGEVPEHILDEIKKGGFRGINCGSGRVTQISREIKK